MSKTPYKKQIIAQNKKARYEFFIEDTLEAGMALTGSEVKSLRQGKASISESYADVLENEVWLLGSHIPEYSKSSAFQHYPRRNRKLLLHRREIRNLIGLIQKKGYSLVPLQIYINKRNKVKLELGIVKGKKKEDKRETIKQRDWDRQKARILKESR